MSKVIFVEGARAYRPRADAPHFVKAALVIERDSFVQWLKAQGNIVRLDIKESQKGPWYLAVNTYGAPVANCPQPETPYKKPEKWTGRPNVDRGRDAQDEFPPDDIPF